MTPYSFKLHTAAIISILVLFSAAFTGCGESQGITALNAHLSEFSELVENYKTTVTTDKSKQAGLDAKIESMSAKWTNIRNQFGSDITPQKMDDFVKQYEKLMLTLADFKKTIGS